MTARGPAGRGGIVVSFDQKMKTKRSLTEFTSTLTCTFRAAEYAEVLLPRASVNSSF